LDRTLPLEFAGGNPQAGRGAYQNHVLDATFDLRCITCHAPNPFALPVGNGGSRTVIADVNLQDEQHQKVPHLRNLYQKTGFTNAPGALSLTGFGYSHDGRDSTLFDHLGTSRLGTLTNNDSATLLVKSNLVALLLCFDTGTPPAVGFARTLTPANVRSTTASNDWALLEQQASTRFQDPFILAGSVTNISLVAQGTLDGQRRSLLYRAPTQDYATDTPGVGPFTRAELWARIEAGDTLTLMGVPTLSGYRMALDRDSDDILNGAELPPPLQVTPSGSQIILSWPSTQPPVVLEFTDRLASAAWNIETHARSETSDRVTVTVPVGDQPRFYRLRGL
jgi:hypothetical protein